MDDNIKKLQSALHRAACVRDWCKGGPNMLPNVAADMSLCIKEIETVIYSLQSQKLKEGNPCPSTTY